MKKNSNIEKEEKEFNIDENKNGKKKKLVILLVIIFILSLVTTGLTTNIFGRIGTAFRNEGSFALKDSEDNAKEVIKNKELKFDSSSLNISVSDSSGKLSYSRERIVPSEYTCETSDATIATCYPADGYVVVYPKKEGKTTVTLRGEANGKMYVATATVNVGEADRYIELASNNGEINLYNNKKKEVAYYLVGMSGDVKATSSDESVAKVSVSKGVLKIEASKVGKTNITVSIKYNGKEYTSVYHLEVINESNTTNNNQSVSKKKSRISTLSSLSVSSGELKFNPSTTDYSIIVGKDVKTIDVSFEKTNANARVIYTIDGIASLSLKNIPLRDGAKEIAITVISEDGSSTTVYKIAVNRVEEDEITDAITGVTVNGKVLSAITPTTYSIRVAQDVETADVTFNLGNNVGSVRYMVGNEVVGEGNSLKNFSLKLGKNTIKVIVRNKFGISMIYFITIERDKPSTNTNIHLDILDDGYDLNQDDDNHYSVPNLPYDKKDLSLSAACEDNDCSSISYEITYEDGTKKKLDDLNKVELKEGNNTIAITVVAEDGKTTDTHYVNIYRPIRSIHFVNTSNDVLVEKEYTDIAYELKEKAEDGTETVVSLDNTDSIKANLTDYSDDVTLEVHQGFIRVIPKNPRTIVGNKDTLKIDYDGKKDTTELNYTIGSYELSSAITELEMTSSKVEKTRAIILNTTLVKSTDSTLSIERSDDGKKLTICDKDKIYCVNLEVDSTKDAGNITLSYGADSLSEIGPNDLPITITGNSDGDSVIKVSGSVYGKSINKDFTIKVTVIKKYLITIYANLPDEDTAKFNVASKVWTDEISKDEYLDLSLVPEPYKVVECKTFAFSHYTTNSDDVNQKDYDRDKKKIILGATLKDDLDLYAIYSEKESKVPETNSLWLSASKQELVDDSYNWEYNDSYANGIPLFHNEEYYAKYNEDKVIYPGVEGSYVMNFTAEDAMTLTGMVFKEESVCVDGKCLNMGYKIRFNEIRRKKDNSWEYNENGTYYENTPNGKVTLEEGNYWILNRNRAIISSEVQDVKYLDKYNRIPDDEDNELLLENLSDDERRVDIVFDENEQIELEAGDQISITIFWKWVEVDDDADTAIGEHAALKWENSSINDMYSLYVGLIYEPVACKVTTP